MLTFELDAKFRRFDSAISMRRGFAPILLAFLIPSVAASAQSVVVKFYTPVAIMRRAASDDESFKTFRHRLAAVAQHRIYAELAALVVTQDFFWDRDFEIRFDPRKPPVDNLAAAIRLEQGNGVGWERLADFAAAGAIEPLPSRPGVVCAPALPDFDTIAFSKLLQVTYTDGIDWAFPRTDDTLVHVAPEAGAAPIGKLGAAFVRLKGYVGAENEPSPGLRHWARVIMPDAKAGFVAPGALMTLAAAKLCYTKDPVNGWRIAGYISGD